MDLDTRIAARPKWSSPSAAKRARDRTSAATEQLRIQYRIGPIIDTVPPPLPSAPSVIIPVTTKTGTVFVIEEAFPAQTIVIDVDGHAGVIGEDHPSGIIEERGLRWFDALLLCTWNIWRRE